MFRDLQTVLSTLPFRLTCDNYRCKFVTCQFSFTDSKLNGLDVLFTLALGLFTYS